MKTDVTIIVATHNRPEMLEVELHSILAAAAVVKPRGISNRILVVDDCSDTAAARDIAASCGADYLRLPENRGVAGALAAGLEQTDSPYHAFWGDDDYMLPRWHQVHLERMAQGFDVVSSSYWDVNWELTPIRTRILPVATLRDLLNGTVTANDGSLIRHSAMDGITLRPERERAMVMTLWLALAAAGRKFTTINEPTWLYRRHLGQLSARSRRTEHDMDLRRAAIAEYAR